MTRRLSLRAALSLGVLAVLLLGIGCSRRTAGSVRDLPVGDAVWFEDGLPGSGSDTDALLAKGGFASVFLPAARISRDAGKWEAAQIEPPPRPLARIPVFLVVGCDRSAREALAVSDRVGSADSALWRATGAALRDGARYGSVAGVHLDLPFTIATAQAYARLVSSLRARMAPSLRLTVTLRMRPSNADRDKLAPVTAEADGFLAMVFGAGELAEPAATDRLERPWWAGYAPAARGSWKSADGESHDGIRENVLASLTDDPRVDFTHDLTLKEESDSVFMLRPRAPVTAAGWTFPAGARVSFRQPSVADLIYRLGADLAGRRFVRGRVVVLSGASERDRVFTLGALDEILTGGSLTPQLAVSVEAGRNFIRVGAENPTPQASVVSRTTNWVEVEVPSAGASDVNAGGFDRYEVFGGAGAPVALSRATRIRFYETLVGPFERIEPARIALRRPPPKDCCATRIHLLAATGKEVAK